MVCGQRSCTIGPTKARQGLVTSAKIPRSSTRLPFWFHAVPGGDVFLDFQDTRGRKAPHAQLANCQGTLQTDANEVYDSLKKVIATLVIN